MKTVCISIVFFLTITSSFCQQSLDVFDIGRKGTVAQAEKIFSENPKAFDVVSGEGYSPLVLACYRRNNAVAKFLIKKNVDINSVSKMGTPLMAAIVKGNNEIAILLIEKKADVNAVDSNGTTALIYAVQFQNLTILKVLVQSKADKSRQDKAGKTAFEYAVFSNNNEIINLLKL